MDNSFKQCTWCWLGSIDYHYAMQIQDALANKLAASLIDPVVLLLEHPHTITLGKRTSPEHLLWNTETRNKMGITVFQTDRGGDITYHGPGQLVCYPILPLGGRDWHVERIPQFDFLEYLRKLEEVIIRVLKTYAIRGYPRENLTGVWVDSNPPKKIASIGVKVDARGISRHGFALNVVPNMRYWQAIIPCGLDDVIMTSMENMLITRPEVLNIARQTVFQFEYAFGCAMKEVLIEELLR